MRSLVRKIARAKWERAQSLEPNEIGADAVTADLRTTKNELTVWECDAGPEELAAWTPERGSPQIADAVLALASPMERAATVDLVLLPQDHLRAQGLQVRPSPENAKIPVDDLKERHFDITALDLVRLGWVAEHIAEAVREAGACRRFSEREVLQILAAAVEVGRLEPQRLSAELQAKVGGPSAPRTADGVTYPQRPVEL